MNNLEELAVCFVLAMIPPMIFGFLIGKSLMQGVIENLQAAIIDLHCRLAEKEENRFNTEPFAEFYANKEKENEKQNGTDQGASELGRNAIEHADGADGKNCIAADVENCGADLNEHDGTAGF